MKKILFLITLMITAATVHLCAASFSVENLTIQAGQNGQLAVSMTNTESNLSGFQFRLYLPEGLSIATNDKGKFQYTLGDRIENHSLTIKALDDGGYQFIAYSMDGDVITGTSGVLLSVPVVPAGNFVSGEGTVSDIRLTDLNANKTTCSNVSFTVTQVIPATGITLNKSAHSFNAAGHTVTLTATVTPANTTNKNVAWTSSNTNVATVSSTGVVTAVADGTATITATTADGTNLSATCEVTVAIPVPATGITLNKSAHSFNAAGQTVTLTATVTPANATNKNVTWTSSNTNVATVSSTGVVTAVADGTATITATTADGTNLSATCEVTVAIPVLATGITLNKSTHSFNAAGQTVTLTATVTPANATNKSVTWTSSNTAVATVSSTGVVTSIADGTATITATTADGTNLSAACEVTVAIPVPATGITLNKSAHSFNAAGQTVTLTATVTPANATNKSVTWTSSNTSVATVSSTGVVTAVADGTATITATTTDGTNLSATCEVTVAIPVPATGITLNKSAHSFNAAGQTVTLTATVIPANATNRNVTWTSSNTAVATVSSTGVVTAVADGTATITATTTDGTNLSATCEVTVAIPVPATGITLNKSAHSFNAAGQTVTLTATVTPANATNKSVTWTSSNTAVATVSSTGVVTAVADGTATITATTTDGTNLSATCQVTVSTSPLISFADNAVKALCVANWDTNGDGELDEDEAAAVTNLGTVFKSNSNITSFNELQHFTGLTSINNQAFASCSKLTSINIPEGVTSIELSAFYSCSGLTSIIIPNSVTSIGTQAFYSCTSLTSINIPEAVNSIGTSAFQKCSILTSINIPEAVTSIGVTTFSGCSSLTSINIPDGVTSIGAGAFASCSSLTSINIPEGVTSIGSSAFSSCSSLTSVTCLAENVPTTGANAFLNVPQSTATLYVPGALLNAYKAAAQWKEFGNIIGNRIYIETDFTSQFPTDWQGWTGATGYTATQYAPMVTTNDGRTVQVCEKFNGGSADLGTVFKRTLTGLTNGTYRIELFGAASSTKGRDTSIDTDMTSSDEGDETAVYLYAKTANGTVKQYIPVHWATSFSVVATAVLNEVVVTDGTVEIGMYGEKKFTNWHVVQIKGVTALVDAEELHANTLSKAQAALDDEAYANVTGEERTALSQAIDDHTTVSERTAEAYQAAITALETATKTFTDAKASYDGLAAAKAIVDGRSYPYATETKKSAAEDAAAAVATSATDAASKTDALLTAYRQYAESSALMEGIENAEDVTATYISNPKAEEGVEGWTTVLGEGSGGSISIRNDQPWTDGSGGTSHKYFDGGNYGVTGWDVAFKQDITLPAGRYQLTAIGRSAQDVTLTLFAGDETAEMAHINADGGLFNLGWEQTSVEFELIQEATVSIGVRGVTSAYHKWMSFSEFRLVQFPESVKIISFADDNVKAICVANWDTNGDDELDEEEAAAVTDLGEVFKENTSITSFDELQYFTGLATIGDYAFDGCSGLTSIMIPEGVTGIGEGTLRGCSGLTSITLPSTLTSTGNESFRNCTGLTAVHISDLEAYCRISFGWYAPLFYAHKLYLNDEEVTGELVIPDGITSVSNVAFEGCTGITSLVIPEGVTSIGRGAFKSTNITSVSLPESLTSIGIEAFQDCSSLMSVAIPGNVTSIQNSAFERCSNLTSVTIGNSVTSIGDYAFKGCYGLTSVTIGSGVTSIGSQAFIYCYDLTSVMIPESVTSIGYNAFYGCSGLIRAEFANIESLCNISFGNNNANPLYFAHHLYIGEQEVTDLVIPEGVTSIGASAFDGCNNLTSVTLPSTLTSVGNYSFRNCTGLTAVHISDLEAYCRISFGWYNPLFYAHKLYLNDEEVTGELVIPDGITSVSDVAFEGCTGITSLVIPEGVTSIGQAAFKSTNITSVSLPESLISIGNGAFQDCPNLTSVTIPGNVTSIGADSFSGSDLTSVNNLSETPQNIGSETFTNRANATLYVPSGTKSAYEAADYWKEFKEIIEPSPISFADANVKAICVANWDTNENGELNEDEAAAVTDLGEVFKNNTTITSFDELQYFTGLTTIGNNAFDGCSGLTSVILPNNVTCIANNAFSYCSSLTSISVPNSLTSIGNSSFWGCSALTSFTIPENVTSIGYSAFDNCSGLTTVTIPNSVTSIGRNAFSGCSSLTSISVAPANTKYDNRNNCNAIIETESNVLIAGCKNTVIPENVTSIGESAFTGSGLTSITIPENVTSIGRDAFSNCSDLTSITIPNSVTSIDFAVFWGCSNLTSVTIPNSVTSIDVLAFHGCSSLTSVISEIEEPFAFGEDAFSGISSECVLIVPAGKTNAYIAQGWTEDVFQGGIIEEAAAGNNLTLADAYGLAGAQCTLPISMSNTESIKGLQFDLRLSEGVTVATNEDDELMFTLTSRAHASHAVSATHLSNGDYRVVVSSLSAKTFKDTEGVIMNVTLSVDKNLAAGDYEVKLLSIVQNTANNVSIKPSDVTATLTISDVAPGDANGDGEINVTDVGMVIDHILENTPSGFIAEAADVNGDGEINVTDVGLIIDIILSDNYAREVLIEDVEEIVEPE